MSYAAFGGTSGCSEFRGERADEFERARAFGGRLRKRNRPDPIPVILLGQLAVDSRYQGKGYARSVLFFALTTAVRLSKDIGCFGVITHPLNDEIRAFYQRFGFEALPFDPKRGMIVRIVDLERNGF
jgi:GNAT superfamily N-acetyltransferase